MHHCLRSLGSILLLSAAVAACSGGRSAGVQRGGCGCCGKGRAPQQATGQQGMAGAPAAVASNKFCPISGQPVDPSVPTSMYQGRVIGFCCAGCKAEFDANPAAYAAKIR
jgi:YHS domain-containing protein